MPVRKRLCRILQLDITSEIERYKNQRLDTNYQASPDRLDEDQHFIYAYIVFNGIFKYIIT